MDTITIKKNTKVKVEPQEVMEILKRYVWENFADDLDIQSPYDLDCINEYLLPTENLLFEKKPEDE